MGKLTASHRSTTYPCCIPALGRFEGAGRTGLTRGEGKKCAVNILPFMGTISSLN